MTYSQALRPLAVVTALGPDALLLAGLRGAEAISEPYRFVLDLVSPTADPDVASLVGTAACAAVVPAEGPPRYVHGLVREVRATGGGQSGTYQPGTYQAEVVPWLWLLSLTTDCRIFQRLTVPEIVEQVFKDAGQSAYQFRLVRTYPKREYCVQYRETALDFVSRLLEDEGIAYHFTHESNRHTLVLTDSPAGARPCPGGGVLQPPRWAAGRNGDAAGPGDASDTYTALSVAHALHPRAVALADYDYEHPSARLGTAAAGADGMGEVFDYPGGYAEVAEGDRYARLRLEAADAQRERAEGASRAPWLTSGHQVTFTGDGPGTGERRWLVTRVEHEARYAAGFLGDGDDAPFTYGNRFTLAAADVPWRPPRRTPRPRVAGTQSALVVGKAGEEIWTDAQGRVKLHFYWDRRGTRDENSSCWVRCSTAWAGRGYGQFSVPRMGQEVLVDFLEGDPDRPVVVGRVYNAEQPPPCDPGGSRGVVSGMRSNTHKGSGANAITMDDTAGKEQLAVQAQYDMVTSVGHDATVTVTNHRTASVGVNEKASVGSNQTLEVGAKRSLTVGGARETSVGSSDTLTVGASATTKVSANETRTVGGNQSLTVGGSRTAKVSGAVSDTVGGSFTADVSGGYTLTVGAALSVTASSSITLTVGGSSIKIGPDGVTISGPKVDVTGSGPVSVTGAVVKVNS